MGPVLAQHESLDSLNARHAPASDYAGALAAADADIATLRGYTAAGDRWAITTAGIYRDSSIKRNTTANCLDAYRARGLIH